jgi:hypothetical protein
MFTLASCLFEIPTGMMGDRLGPRRVLTRIVVWWPGLRGRRSVVAACANLGGAPRATRWCGDSVRSAAGVSLALFR